ncbi:AroM family protein [Desulfovibrio gilichinskyi]|uniref:Protein AroM n=1 Tax=Desulfovibrio gilichinskyi TaxID=1519643 RepID=A0A1X7C0W4_9BACT|nr:AroM family protein [Desulfovibrio gilichinskyi]SME88012.1 protein AroM [Desulfovibrio gilichinskyi]
MQNNFTLGLLTLGQSPRTDVESTLRSMLGECVILRQRGGLDGLSEKDVEALAPTEGDPGIETCISTQEDKIKGVFVSKEQLLPKLILAAQKLENECNAFFLLCSGQFPALKQAVPKLIEPIVFIRSVIAELAGQSRLCIIGPQSDMGSAPKQWQPYAASVVTAAASPYGGMECLEKAAMSAKDSGAEYIFLDDMGFTEEQRQYVRQISGRPTLNATTITARILAEII